MIVLVFLSCSGWWVLLYWWEPFYEYRGEHFYYRSSSGVVSPDFGVAIPALFLICSHQTVWNPKSKDFWEKTMIAFIFSKSDQNVLKRCVLIRES